MANLAFLCQAHDAVRNALVALLIQTTVFDSLPHVRVEKGGGYFPMVRLFNVLKRCLGKISNLGANMRLWVRNFLPGRKTFERPTSETILHTRVRRLFISYNLHYLVL
jgi:hypothetical protein